MEITKITLSTKPNTSSVRKEPISNKTSTFSERKKPLSTKFNTCSNPKELVTSKLCEPSIKAISLIPKDNPKKTLIVSKNAATATLNNKHEVVRPSRIRIVQNFTLIWLDSDINESDSNFKQSLEQVRQIVNTISIFRDIGACVNFLSEINDIQVFMIVSGAFLQSTIPRIHDISQIDSIYIFSTNESQQEQWKNEWAKVRGIFNEITSICDLLKRNIRQYDRDSMPISVTSSDLSRLNPSFMYTQLLKEILIEMPHNEKEKAELADFCRQQYSTNLYELKIIDEFERNYFLYTPIWWYTRESFLYQMLNCALRIEDVEIIIKMGFLLRDIHQQIKELHSHIKCYDSFTVYRGQCMSNSDFEKIKNSKGGLLAFNSFLSTSVNEKVSFKFAQEASHKPDSIGILFKMTINPSISSTPFAYLDKISFYKDSEKEVLFSMHTVFRIGQIKLIDDRFWCVKLTSASENDDQELKRLTEHVRKETQGATAWHRIGKLLIKTGSFDKAEEVCQILLQETSTHDKQELSLLYDQLAYVKKSKGDYKEALNFYQKSLDIRQILFSPNHPDLAETYGSIGLVHDHLGQYLKALDFYKKSLEIWQNIVPLNYSKLAFIYNNIGAVHMHRKEYFNALKSYEKALENEKKCFSSNHPNLVITCSNIALMHKNLTNYPKALEFYHKALTICETSLPSDHTWLTTIYNNISLVHQTTKDYLNALQFYQKMLEIQQKCLSSNHPLLGSTYRNIGLMYQNLEEYSKTLEFYFKALEIYQKFLPPHNIDFGIIYNRIGQVYDKMGDYSKAILFCKRAIDIGQESLSQNDPHLRLWQKNFIEYKAKVISTDFDE